MQEYIYFIVFFTSPVDSLIHNTYTTIVSVTRMQLISINIQQSLLCTSTICLFTPCNS